jgi:nitric oxide reductase NorE protein
VRVEAQSKRVPGEPGVWVVICGDLVLFGFLFLTYLNYRLHDSSLFARSQRALSTDLGVIYTLLMLSSSLLVALAVNRTRERSSAGAPLVLGAMGCGLAFAVLKTVEYHAKVHNGITPASNRFFLLYFVLTGLHLAHLVIGLGVLTYLWTLARRAPGLTPGQCSFAEGCACFWHMVDLLWIVLFPLLYLVR